MLILLLAAPLLGPQADAAGPPTALDFAAEVRPLLARKCFPCHGNDEGTREAGLRLDSFAEATADRDGFAALVPGSPDDSELWLRITDDVDPMPPEHAGEMLDDEERGIIRRWIEGGGAYAPHWAFVPPERPAVPDGPAGTHPVDAFIDRRLALEGLTRSGPAADAILLRRLSLDLTGLPPTPEEVRTYCASTDPGKYPAAVERLLTSPAYAERWAAVWLDLARYADSAGHGSDPLRTIWRYRDWVIDAFDRNMPFDEFTVQQLAGDLVPGATHGTRLATAFHRNTMTNTEGGTDDEEFRVLAVKDRVNTTMQVWTGLTFACAECHSHKYDPISHVDYYRLFDVFNHTADTDRNDDAPRMDTPTREQRVEWERLGTRIAEVEGEIAALRDGAARAVSPEAAADLRARGDLSSFDRSGVTVIAALRSDDEPETVGQLDDGTIVIDGSDMAAVRTLEVAAPAAAPTELLIEAIAHDDLPLGGPGRNSASGNFVLTHLTVEALPAEDAAPVRAKVVRVELPGEGRILSLAEVELLGPGGARLAFEGTARQSSTGYGGEASRAIDGVTDGHYASDSVTHTATESNPWWEVELAEAQDVHAVRLRTRTDGDLAARLHGYQVVMLDTDGAEVWRSALAPSMQESAVLGPTVGQPLLLTAGSASHEQPGFELRRAVDGIHSERDGWAIGGGEGRTQAALLRLPELGAPTALRVRMEHRWGTDHVLGRFRIGVGTSAALHLALPGDVAAALALEPAERTDAQRQALGTYLAENDPEIDALTRERNRLAQERMALGVVSTPVMEELPAGRRRTSHVLVRGNFLQKAEEVQGDIPVALGGGERDGPMDRLALARWLVSRDNPLTARVAVNRVWAQLFGRGIVATEGDFGSQGDPPTHPALLDWLAVEFMESGWDHRALLRTIVLSETYRQSSVMDPERASADPDAALLSRYPRQRLCAEMVRDHALAASGLLSRKRFGPSVFPPQPEGMWKAAFNNQRDWTTSEGEDRYRRALYVFLRRTVPYPMLETFDAPSREVCTVQRVPTNTPLQALVTLNDPAFVEGAQALGRELMAMARGQSNDAALREGWLRATSRFATDEQAAILGELLGDALASFTDPEEARAFAEDPLGPLPDGADPALAAAWTLVASSLLNLDAALTKE